MVTTQHGGQGYVRKLRERRRRGVGLRVRDRAGAVRAVPRALRRGGDLGVLFEGGAQLISRALIERQLDYLLMYHAPVIFADERAKSVLSGLRAEHLAQAIRLEDIRRLALGDDSLVRGRVAYPEKVQIDETLFSLG